MQKTDCKKAAIHIEIFQITIIKDLYSMLSSKRQAITSIEVVACFVYKSNLISTVTVLLANPSKKIIVTVITRLSSTQLSQFFFIHFTDIITKNLNIVVSDE